MKTRAELEQEICKMVKCYNACVQGRISARTKDTYTAFETAQNHFDDEIRRLQRALRRVKG